MVATIPAQWGAVATGCMAQRWVIGSRMLVYQRWVLGSEQRVDQGTGSTLDCRAPMVFVLSATTSYLAPRQVVQPGFDFLRVISLVLK
jgi:hypothetical protein